jgi:glucose-1-phosphate cytidylyltransferase
MKTYSHWDFNDFPVPTGYLSHVIKEFFINYYTRYSDITVDMAANSVEIHRRRSEPDGSLFGLFPGSRFLSASVSRT